MSADGVPCGGICIGETVGSDAHDGAVVGVYVGDIVEKTTAYPGESVRQVRGGI